MKNKEYYASKLADLAIEGALIAIDKETKEPFNCYDTICKWCLMGDESESCILSEKRKEWGEMEHEE